MAMTTVVRRTCALAAVLLLAVGCGDDDSEPLTAGDDETSSAGATETSAPDSTETAGEPTEPADLEFRPVLQLLPPGGAPDGDGDPSEGCMTTDEAWAPDQTVLAPQLADGQEVGCYELGPAEADRAVVGSAAAVEDGMDNWMLALVLTSDGIVEFNETARSCFDAAPTCPTRQLAIVVDRAVISAPSINAPEFERDQISISGDFTRAEAEALAAGLG